MAASSTDSLESPVTRLAGEPRPVLCNRRWPLWAPPAVGVWSAVYATVRIIWSAAGTTVPWKPHEAIATPVLLMPAALAVLARAASVLEGHCWSSGSGWRLCPSTS